MRRRAVLAGLALGLGGCGYRLVHAPADPLGPFEVVAGRVYVPDAGAIGAMEEGARAELSRAGALGPGGGAIEVELLRFDMESEGIAAGKGAAGAPLARGVRVVALGRARMRRAGSTAVDRDTGDVGAGGGRGASARDARRGGARGRSAAGRGAGAEAAGVPRAGRLLTSVTVSLKPPADLGLHVGGERAEVLVGQRAEHVEGEC
jgi:hypothetical protein